MPTIYEKELVISPSLTDADGYLNVPGAFGILMDIASEHAATLGCGMTDMRKKGLFWLTVKTRVRFLKRPFLGETVRLRTWPETPERVRANRSYELRQNGELLLCGKTEWAVLDVAKNRPVSADDLYPAGIEYTPSASGEPFARIPDRFEGIEPYATYTVRSTDIDVGRHMNNVAYVRAIAGSFLLKEWTALSPRQMEVHFRAPCYEGDRIEFRKTPTEDGLDLRLSTGDTTLVLARIS